MTSENESLIDELSQGRETITLAIPFLNDDVPKYLEKLRAFEEHSRTVSIVVNG